MKKNLQYYAAKTFLVCVILLAPTAVALAQPVYTPLASIPFLEGKYDLNSVLNALFTLLVVIASILAVLFIAIAGLKYMGSAASVGSKEHAKEDIKNSLLGLALILAAIILLNVINPCITKFNLFTTNPGC